MGSHGARAGREQLLVGLAPQRQAAQNWVLIGFFSLLQPKLHKGIPLLSRAPTMTQISRSLLAEPQAGQEGRFCWNLVGRVLTVGWVVGLGVPKSGAGGAVPAWLVAYPMYLHFQDSEDRCVRLGPGWEVREGTPVLYCTKFLHTRVLGCC